jgi:hypothetical protein
MIYMMLEASCFVGNVKTTNLGGCIGTGTACHVLLNRPTASGALEVQVIVGGALEVQVIAGGALEVQVIASPCLTSSKAQ